MYVIIVKNHKRKMILACLIVTLWIIAFFISDMLFHKSLMLSITINNYLSFSYPLRFDIDKIYVNEILEGEAIETSFTFDKPLSYKFKDFITPDGKFSFLYPSFFVLNQQDFSGSDILYHIDFKDDYHSVKGFVQVWNMPYSLKDFLTTSKENSQLNYKYFSMKSIMINDNPGYIWDYAFIGNDGKTYKGVEAFFKKDGRMYRISYFVPENKWDESQSDIFWSMVKSIKTY